MPTRAAKVAVVGDADSVGGVECPEVAALGARGKYLQTRVTPGRRGVVVYGER